MNFDFDALYRELLTASRKAFTKIKENYQEENIYVMALMTSSSYSYLFPTANTEERLEKAANKIHSAASLRWNPGDWRIFDGKEYFQGVNKQMVTVRGILDKLIKNMDMDAYIKFRNSLENCVLDMFKKLDEESIFGNDRKKMYVNLVMGEQYGQDLLYNANKVNPPEVIEKMKREFQYKGKIK